MGEVSRLLKWKCEPNLQFFGIFGFRAIAQHIGRYIKLKETRPKEVAKIPVLELAFKKHKKSLPTDQATLDVSHYTLFLLMLPHPTWGWDVDCLAFLLHCRDYASKAICQFVTCSDGGDAGECKENQVNCSDGMKHRKYHNSAKSYT